MQIDTIKVHKIRLKPTPEQVDILTRSCAAARYAYNFGVACLVSEYNVNRDMYKIGVPSGYLSHHLAIKKQFNKLKPDWIRTKNGTATPEAFDDLGKTLSKFYNGRKDGTFSGYRKNGLPNGFPKFRYSDGKKSFRHIYPSVIGKTIQYSKECGPIKMCEEFRFLADKFMRATFSFDGFYWNVSISARLQVEQPVHCNENSAVGVDLGIKYLASTSDEKEPFENPKAFYKLKAKLRQLQRKLDRQRRANNPDNYNDDKTVKAGARNWNSSSRMGKTELAVKKLHLRISNIRDNASHQLTAKLTDDHGIICLEDLNVKGMMKNGKLAKAIADAAFYEKRRQFEYKSTAKGGITSVVSRWYPSSKTCHNCKIIKTDLSLSDREWICQDCGSVNERDENAAKNLRDEGVRILLG